MTDWYTRPVLFVADLECALDFYIKMLGFSEAWRHTESGSTLVAQVDRAGCEIILTCQWPEMRGHGMLFVSLSQSPDAIRDELEARGVKIIEGFWGYRCLIVRDPDGNRLYFPYPQST